MVAKLEENWLSDQRQKLVEVLFESLALREPYLGVEVGALRLAKLGHTDQEFLGFLVRYGLSRKELHTT
jgi:hypothetical protein